MLKPSMGRLLHAVDNCRVRQPGGFQDRRRDVNDVMELRTDLALGLDALRPVHDRAVARAAPVRRDLLGPLIRRIHRMRPADRVVVVGVRSAEVVDLALQELDRLDCRHAVQHRHFVEAAVQRSFGRGAVVADDVDRPACRRGPPSPLAHRPAVPRGGRCARGTPHRFPFAGRGSASAPAASASQAGISSGRFVSSASAGITPSVLLAGEDLLTQLVPALIELALVLVGPLLRHVMRGVAKRPARST